MFASPVLLGYHSSTVIMCCFLCARDTVFGQGASWGNGYRVAPSRPLEAANSQWPFTFWVSVDRAVWNGKWRIMQIYKRFMKWEEVAFPDVLTIRKKYSLLQEKLMQWLMDKSYLRMKNHWVHDCAIRQGIVVTSAWHKQHLISSSRSEAIKYWDILLFFTPSCYSNHMSTRSEKSCFSTLFKVAKEIMRSNFRCRICQIFWN